MNKIKFLIYLLPMLVTAFSCSREIPPAAEEDSSSMVCSHSNLVHHGAVAATFDECGLAEYWQCPLCGAKFEDASATKPFTGMVYTLPRRIVDVDFNRFNQSDISTRSWATVATITGLIVTVGSLIASTVSIIYTLKSTEANTDVLAEKVKDLSSKTDKTQEELEKLQTLTSELTTKTKELGSKVAEATIKVADMNVQINQLLARMASTEILEDSVLNAIADMEKNVIYGRILDERYRKSVDLRLSSISAWRAVEKYLKQYSADDSISDPLEAYGKCAAAGDNITSVVSSWGKENAGYAALTSELFSSFFNAYADEKTTFPEMMEKYYSDHFIWDHNRRAIVQLFLTRDQFALSLASNLANLYYNHCSGLDSCFAQSMASSIQSQYEDMAEVISEYKQKLDTLYSEGPWHCSVTGKTFEASIINLRPEDFLDGKDVTVENGEIVSFSYPTYYLYNETDTADAMTLKDLEMIRRDFKAHTDKEASSLYELLFSQDRTGMIFDGGGSATFKQGLIIPYTDEFSVSDGNLYVECYTSPWSTEKIKIGTVAGDADTLRITGCYVDMSFFTLNTTSGQ